MITRQLERAANISGLDRAAAVRIIPEKAPLMSERFTESKQVPRNSRPGRMDKKLAALTLACFGELFCQGLKMIANFKRLLR